jgi:hypothetical protein
LLLRDGLGLSIERGAGWVDDVELGPIDHLVVEWPPATPPNGEAFPLFVDLVDRGLIRILDLAVIQKQEDGSVVGLNLGDLDLDGNPELAGVRGDGVGAAGRRRRRGGGPRGRAPCP